MKKRILSILLAALMLCVLVPQLAGIASADIVKGTCGENVKWSFDTVTGILTISGTGDMDSYSTTTNAPWKNLQDDILKLVIEDGVTNVGGWAFRDYTALTSVTIADSVTNIGDRAFYGCTGLKSLTIGKGVTTIAKYAFSGCTALSELNLNMDTIGNWFQGSTVTTLVLGDNVNSILRLHRPDLRHDPQQRGQHRQLRLQGLHGPCRRGDPRQRHEHRRFRV